MIYLNAEVVSGLGEDTWWRWMHREFPDSQFGPPPDRISKDDIVFQYSTLGPPKHPRNTIALLWELHPEMAAQLGSHEWDGIIRQIGQCAAARFRTTPSHLMLPYYEQYGRVDVLPIGIDTDLVRPVSNKAELRGKYGVPQDRPVGFWCGTTHRMKGFDRLLEYAQAHLDVFWVIVWKQPHEAGHMPGAANFCHVSQTQMAELMNCADFFLACGRLRPYFLVEWEALACDLSPIFIDGTGKDFVPGRHPREDIFRLKWDRPTAKRLWADYMARFVEENTE